MNTHSSILHSAKLKATSARLAVLGYLDEERRPLDVDEIYNHLRKEHGEADLVTIYRILDSFYKKGLVTRVDFQEGKFRYERAGQEHHHLICEKCGRIEDITDCKVTEFQESIARKKDFFIKRHSLEFFGLCKLCQR